ncbi:MAG: triose-phosphate isomerase [Candidatus Saccharibacteria bacterium]|nr:triose-phosphate isomerase [Candidatus Saccharibacteria bacterium]
MKTFVVGNWKMNLTVGESSLFLQKLQKKIKPAKNLEVVVAPSAIALQTLSLQLERNKSKIKLAAQNFHYRDYGAFTGEISVSQLHGIIKYAIVGHSERRHIFGETNREVKMKVAAAIRNNIRPIICIGETEGERASGETADVIRDQLLSSLSEIDVEDFKKVIIAYEPVWAISGGKSSRAAAPDEVIDVIRLIHTTLADTYGKEIEENIPVLYGGSVNADNAGAYLTMKGVNGLLIGGASLMSEPFCDIVETAKRVIA